MLFMNRWDIDEAQRRYVGDPVMGPATQTLVNLRDCADENSDGWAYWPKPCRAAKQLQELIQRQERQDRCSVPTMDAVSGDEVLKAYRPIKAFRTRTGLAFDIVEVG